MKLGILTSKLCHDGKEMYTYKKACIMYLLYSVHILLFLLFSNTKSELSVKLSGEGGGKDRHFKVGSLQA